MNYYISDLHVGHFNVIRFDNRPFQSVDEMDKTIISNWNNVVTEEDTVYILGDVSWYKEQQTIEFLEKLKGKKVLVKGNHDRISPRISKCFERICDYLDIADNGTRVIMSHYPMPFWNGQFRDSVHLYGHVHNSHQWNIMESWLKEARELQDIPMRAYNVGCMMEYMNYTPQTLEKIIQGGSPYKK